MSYFADQDIDTRTCGQADEDAWLDLRDGLTAMEKTIKYDRSTRDFACYVDGVLIGFFGSYHAAEIAADEYVFEALTHTNACGGFGCVDGCDDCEVAA